MNFGWCLKRNSKSTTQRYSIRDVKMNTIKRWNSSAELLARQKKDEGHDEKFFLNLE